MSSLSDPPDQQIPWSHSFDIKISIPKIIIFILFRFVFTAFNQNQETCFLWKMESVEVVSYPHEGGHDEEPVDEALGDHPWSRPACPGHPRRGDSEIGLSIKLTTVQYSRHINPQAMPSPKLEVK